MKIHRHLTLLILCYGLALMVQADDVPVAGAIAPRPLVDISGQGVEGLFEPSCSQVTVASASNPQGVTVTIQPGDAVFPGVTLKPTLADRWDLSPFSRIEARITNTGAKPLYLSLRIDGDSWEQNNSDGAGIDPGKTATVTVRFGYTYGKAGQKLNTASPTRKLRSAR